jgi:hypothetical protein
LALARSLVAQCVVCAGGVSVLSIRAAVGITPPELPNLSGNDLRGDIN